MKRFFAIFCAILSVLSLLGPWPYALVQPALADGFDPNLVIADADLTTSNVPDDFAQKFLEAHGSGIASMKFADVDGTFKKPGDLITYYGKLYGVNPKYLLALIQKEQRLVTDPSPSGCQIDWAAGYGRPDGSTCNDPNWQKHRGFANQIIGAASFAQCFYQDVSSNCGAGRNFGYQAGALVIIDSKPVIPQNTATAMLYSYTPHLHGNQLLSSIWQSWFQASYPDGSVLRGSNGTAYLIEGGLKRRFASMSALASRVNSSRILTVSDDVLTRYVDGPVIKFADYSLVRIPTGGIYLLSGDVKRPIVSMKVFRSIGFDIQEVDDVTVADLADYPDGEPITLKTAYPTGALLRTKASSTVFWVENGVKHPILVPEILQADFAGKRVAVVAPSLLDNYAAGDPVKFKDGELITSPGAGGVVFVVSNGTRRPIASTDDLVKLGYRLDRVITTSDAALDLQPVGATVSYVSGDVTPEAL